MHWRLYFSYYVILEQNHISKTGNLVVCNPGILPVTTTMSLVYNYISIITIVVGILIIILPFILMSLVILSYALLKGNSECELKRGGKGSVNLLFYSVEELNLFVSFSGLRQLTLHKTVNRLN